MNSSTLWTPSGSTFTVRESGEALKTISPVGRRVRAMVDKVKYDTEAASALRNNFYADGMNEYTETGRLWSRM